MLTICVANAIQGHIVILTGEKLCKFYNIVSILLRGCLVYQWRSANIGEVANGFLVNTKWREWRTENFDQYFRTKIPFERKTNLNR